MITDNARGTRRRSSTWPGSGTARIAYVAGPEASWADGMRWRSLREAAVDLDCGCGGSARTRRPSPAARRGRRAGRAPGDGGRGLQRPVAIGADPRTAAPGVRVPQDSASSGSTTSSAPSACSPTLTTVAAPLAALGRYAVQTLLHRDVVRTPRRCARPAFPPSWWSGTPPRHGPAAGDPDAYAGRVMATDCHGRVTRRR